jgi:hypothetical protein
MNLHRTLALGALAAIAAILTVTTGAAGSTPAKQRIAIVEKIGFNGGKATFEVIPLTPGPLQHDSGTIDASDGDQLGTVTRNGQRLAVLAGVDSLTGKQGKLELSARFERAELGGGYGVATGTWSLKSGTGAYANVVGGGRLASLDLPLGRIFVRQDGYVHSR